MPIPKRFLELVRAGLVASLFAPIAISQTPQQAPAAYVPTETRADPDLPRTSFGHPSLEGVWGSNWVLPLEASSRVPMLVLPEEVAQGYAAAYAKGVGDALDRQLDPEVPETMRNVEGLPLVRGERRARAVVIPANGMLPYTAKARAESERGQPGGGYNNPEERPNWERCVRSLGQPPLYPIGNTPRQIIQRPDKVIIFTEYGGEARITPGDACDDVAGGVDPRREPRGAVQVEGEGASREVALRLGDAVDPVRRAPDGIEARERRVDPRAVSAERGALGQPAKIRVKARAVTSTEPPVDERQRGEGGGLREKASPRDGHGIGGRGVVVEDGDEAPARRAASASRRSRSLRSRSARTAS